ncbi:pyridoxine 5'-phosphate oxidase C-terminal domain-containing protein [Dactylosporangium sp. NPDC005572]|uniref:pyridoxine 5'-phosphate oxidase C-terminal domain-containing protein n=1 Tax=Dactylosporangium sp. NPDC005572 TaxID=3156889 RepID=UPI0033BCDD7B
MTIETLTGDTSLVLQEFDDTVPPGVREPQSAPLHDEAALRRRAADLLMAGARYRVTPTGVEFWHGSVDRRHRRLRYDQQTAGSNPQRLQP